MLIFKEHRFAFLSKRAAYFNEAALRVKRFFRSFSEAFRSTPTRRISSDQAAHYTAPDQRVKRLFSKFLLKSNT